MTARQGLESKLVIRKEFRFAGKTFKPGKVFPWRQLSCSERKLRALISGSYVVDEAKFKAESAKAEAKAKTKKAQKVAADTERTTKRRAATKKVISKVDEVVDPVTDKLPK